ncbi:MAG: DoxX family protein [Pricia sp.]
MNKKTRNIVGWLLTGFVALILLASGGFKLSGGNPEMIAGIGGETNLVILGVLEIVIVVLLLIPKTAIIGTLLAVAYMGGAIAVHFTGGQPLMVPVLIEILIWIAAFVRLPELSQRILTK